MILAKKKLACKDELVIQIEEYLGCDDPKCCPDHRVELSTEGGLFEFIKPERDLRIAGETLLKAADKYDEYLEKKKAAKKKAKKAKKKK